MNTLKSAAVIVVLLGVLYGVYVALNKPQAVPPLDVSAESLDAPQIEYGGVGDPAPGDHAAHADHGASESGGSGLPAPWPPAGSQASPYDSTTAPANQPPLAADSQGSYNAYASATAPTDSPENAAPPAAALPGSAPPLETPAPSPNTEPPGVATPAVESPAAQPAATPSNPALTAWSLKQDWYVAEQAIAAGKFREALSKLSPYYGNAEISPQDHANLVGWLDALAGKVIYSREHYLTERYQVRGRETLYDIAAQYQVPAELLHSINAHTVNDPGVLVPGTELKIVPGPFRADVNLAKGEVTVFLNELYAGRFPFSLGNEQPPPGSYKVADKAPSRTYLTADGQQIPANDPSNPYGNAWIDLGHEVSIHGSPAQVSGANESLGCISLSPQDARDLYGILSLGSEVTIRR